MKSSTLFESLPLGALDLPNRLVMAPLTRMRAAPGGVATELMADYYSQHWSAGLIISEGTAINSLAHGYPASPGIYTAGQIAAWRVVTDRVHSLGGRIVMQIQHNGRNSLPAYNSDGSLPVAPSAVPYVGKVYTPAFVPLDPPAPRALKTSEIPALIESFSSAAANAMAAGFDGVEIQGANGHLIDQFLCDGSNRRTDSYGGTLPARARFLLEVVDSTVAPRSGGNTSGCGYPRMGNTGASSIPIQLHSSVTSWTNSARERSPTCTWSRRAPRRWASRMSFTPTHPITRSGFARHFKDHCYPPVPIRQNRPPRP